MDPELSEGLSPSEFNEALTQLHAQLGMEDNRDIR